MGHEREHLDSNSQNRTHYLKSTPIDSETHHHKRIKIEPTSDSDEQRQDYDETVQRSMHSLFPKNHHQALRENQKTSLGIEIDESESQYTYSNSSSPQFQGQDQESSSTGLRKVEDSTENEDEASKFLPNVQVIAASGDNIIAVANPALAMSPALLSHSSIRERREDAKD
ncbi:unnamed protein product [Ceutorhynchus assimilis]|uniref:Uncharacterized protein n=1 Tax=Ceutorhynchus assimilis TaxID=467358 RepID=A0A9N9QDG6_9CUCU|nr:unnamed protein product [Ceutorhynchus assimilis]